MLGRRVNRLIIYKTHVCRYPLMCLYVFKVRHKQSFVCLRNCVLNEEPAKEVLY